jgi:hypothetical protein
MKRNLSLLFLSLAVVLGLSMSASAQVWMTTTGTINGGVYPGTSDETGPYAGTINGGPTTNFVCDDATNLSVQPWQANVYQSNPVSVGLVKFNSSSLMPGASQQQLYNGITYLAMLILQNPSNVSLDEAANAAIWTITSNGTWDGGAPLLDSNVMADINAAIGADNSYNGDLNVYTPTSAYAGTDQEFLGTPEPLSMALMGTFLTLAGLGLGKKKLFA